MCRYQQRRGTAVVLAVIALLTAIVGVWAIATLWIRMPRDDITDCPNPPCDGDLFVPDVGAWVWLLSSVLVLVGIALWAVQGEGWLSRVHFPRRG
jgi:hypothetical protein